jgi:hypothetical protein
MQDDAYDYDPFADDPTLADDAAGPEPSPVVQRAIIELARRDFERYESERRQDRQDRGFDTQRRPAR